MLCVFEHVILLFTMCDSRRCFIIDAQISNKKHQLSYKSTAQ